MVEQREVADPDAHVGQVDHALAQPRRRERGQLDAVSRRRLVGDQRRRGIEPELGLARPGGRTAPQPGEFLAEQVAPALVERSRLPGPFGPGQHVCGVAAVVAVHLTVGDLPGPVADLIEEPPVVRDHDERCLVLACQVAGQPPDRLDVQVVRRLVEQQEVVRAAQQRRERDPAAFAAGQALCRRVEVDAYEQRGQAARAPWRRLPIRARAVHRTRGRAPARSAVRPGAGSRSWRRGPWSTGRRSGPRRPRARRAGSSCPTRCGRPPRSGRRRPRPVIRGRAARAPRRP